MQYYLTSVNVPPNTVVFNIVNIFQCTIDLQFVVDVLSILIPSSFVLSVK